MVIKTLYLIITAFLISVGVLRKKLTNRAKAISYVSFTTAWAFGVFGITMMFAPADGVPSEILFYTAIIPTFVATILLIISIK